MCVCVYYITCLVPVEAQRRSWTSWNRRYVEMVVSHPVDAGNRTGALCWSRQRSKRMSYLFGPLMLKCNPYLEALSMFRRSDWRL